ncbi:quaternary ammonium compound efflux SMR transporter BcrC [Listeria innocua]|nr:quaternary ammonium compound efflux SMR transporter BcrC [Listeria innocua]ELD3651906.1 quaternary ammonium compound efflux SMR transporter BcrC [Listeria innocua]
MMKGYVALGIAIISEIFGTSMLKLSEGFTNIYPTIGVAIGFFIAFYTLSLSLKTLPLSLAYAIWSGGGTALTALIGVLVWNEPFNILTFIGLVMIVGGVIILNQRSADTKTSTSH